MINKVVADAHVAIRDIQDGMTLLLGGFGLCGIPENCIAALVKKGAKDLTCISNNAGVDDFGIGRMLQQLPGSAVFESAMSFGMIRSQKVDLTILGAMEVSENGDIANWKIPGKMVKGMGGAMDLVASAKNIIVAMQQVNKAGESKLLPLCSLPLTGVKCMRKIVTELGVYEIDQQRGAFVLLERAPGISVQQIKDATTGKLIAEGEIPEMVL
ncbi:3-oxoacid CoA-transferase, B subunit [bacterium A37T11]|nr:3-oxoacid CoA-transferase, B subunit [bacterium A37T11]